MIHKKQFYQKIDKDKIANDLKKEGYNPLFFSDDAGFLYPEHQHPETKLMVFLEGSMELTINGKKISCSKGDKVIIPGNTRHSAKIGEKGCTFFWSEKII